MKEEILFIWNKNGNITERIKRGDDFELSEKLELMK